jgi:hypothetical protein
MRRSIPFAGPFTTAEAYAAGLTSGVLRGPSVRRLFAGVRAASVGYRAPPHGGGASRGVLSSASDNDGGGSSARCASSSKTRDG